MNLFRRLLGAGGAASDVEVLPDRVWLSSEAKLEGIRRELDERCAAGASLIALVAHFPDVLGELERLTAERTGEASVRAILARRLSAGAAAGLPLAESNLLEMIVAERHPLASEDDALLEFAGALPFRCRIVHHVSFEDPLMQAFDLESVRTAMDRMGATEGEAITHPLVTRSIRRAQQKIEARSPGRVEAASAAEWLARNG